MNNKKLNTILYIVVFIFVFIMFLATSYAYYNKVLKKDDTPKEVSNFIMLVNFDTSNVINANNLKNNFVVNKIFSIENYSEDTIGKYNIVLEIITPLSNMVDEEFVYTLEGESISKDNSNKVVSIPSTPVPVLTKTIGSGIITPKNTHSYNLGIKLNNNKYASNSLFNALVKVTIDK